MAAQKNPEVTAFMAGLDHPLKAEIEATREIVLGVDPGIGELIKWKAPTFRAADDFATVHLRASDALTLIFHTGVRVKDGDGPKVEDPAGLLKWLARDRAMVVLGAGVEIEARRPAFEALVRAWIAQVPA
jgi:hypothetical protein